MDVFNIIILYVKLLISWRFQGHVYGCLFWIKNKNPWNTFLFCKRTLEIITGTDHPPNYLMAARKLFEVFDLTRVLKSAVNVVLGN
jgi:hypothetical protein